MFSHKQRKGATTFIFLGEFSVTLLPVETSNIRGRSDKIQFEMKKLNFDILVRNGRVIDGAGNPWFKADIGISNDKIEKIGAIEGAAAAKCIEASGLIVCPGFIDIHNHSDTTILTYPKCDSMIMQGVTTQVIGNCGNSAAPVKDVNRTNVQTPDGVPIDWHTFDQYLSKVEKQGVSTNIASLVGHGTIRLAVMGWEARAPTKGELEEMKKFVAESMEDGAFGLSTGLAYTPGAWADTDEIVQLCKIAAEYGGYYATHIRYHGWKERLASKEAIEIGKKAGIQVVISHLETHYPAWGTEEWIVQGIDEARSEGYDVTCDITPELWGGTGLLTLIPEKYHEGGHSKVAERLKNPRIRREIVKEVAEEIRIWPTRSLAADGEWDKFMVTRITKNTDLLGKSLAEIAKMKGKEPYEAVFDLLMEEERPPGVLYLGHLESDMQKLLKHHTSMIESDGRCIAPYGPEGIGKSHPHPRYYGVFPLVFRKYVRGETRADMPEEVGNKILTWEEAVRKMTSLPAQSGHIQDRGLLRAGMYADIVIFNPDTITDKATYKNPHQFPEGIPYVIVNGQIAVENSVHTGALPGKVLRGLGYRKKAHAKK